MKGADSVLAGLADKSRNRNVVGRCNYAKDDSTSSDVDGYDVAGPPMA